MEPPQVNNGESQELIDTENNLNLESTPAPTVNEKPKEPEPVKKSKEEKSRKKDEKSLEHVIKSLSSLGSNDEKFTALCKKYSEVADENRKLQAQLKQCDKKATVLQREKEQLQGEQSKAVLTRSRLESLCRELQRQNKAIKEESLLRIREEEEKRKVVSAKFQATLSEITTLMQQNNENNSKLRDENIEMQNKFKSVCEQYELREQQVEKISKQMQLESQLADAKMAKVKIEMVAEREILANEKKQLLIELASAQNKIQELQKTEAALRGQISMYTEKYDEFQNALSRSNQLYNGFKGEMEKMSKKITKLEKETSVWKMKWENSHKALLQMAAEKQQRDADLQLSSRQLTQLQKLCRTLQSERSSLLTQLKNEGLTPKLTSDENSAQVSNDIDQPENKGSGDASSIASNDNSPNTNINSNSELVPESEVEITDSKPVEENSVKTDEETTAAAAATTTTTTNDAEEKLNVESVVDKEENTEERLKNSDAEIENQIVPSVNGSDVIDQNLVKNENQSKSSANPEPRKSKENSRRRKK